MAEIKYNLETLQKIYGKVNHYVSKNARPLNLEALTDKWREILKIAINFIRESYAKDYVPLTIRQVHYHLIHATSLYQGDLRHCKKLTKYILRARVSGLIGWEMISEEESTVFDYTPPGMNPDEAIKEALKNAKYAAGKNPWKEMNKYIIIITEKRELGPQLNIVASKYYVRLICMRGYGMWSRLYREALRIKEALKQNLECYAIFVTDHDPSGLDLNRFGAAILKNFWKLKIIDLRAMLTYEQIKKYNLPPAPVKIKDPRAKWYTKLFGHDAWEVDALGKERMIEILSETLESLIDKDVWDKVMKENEENMRKIEKLAKEYLES